MENFIFVCSDSMVFSWEFENLSGQLLYERQMNSSCLWNTYFQVHSQKNVCLSSDLFDQSLREKYSNTEFFLVRIFLYSD